ncbi:ABC transporter ATP-binding protein [Glutamicibacter sp. X7]
MSGARQPMLEARIDSFRFDRSRHPILHGSHLQVVPGTLNVIVGASGSGKSTLGAVLAGMLPRPGLDLLHGQLRLDGQQIDHRDGQGPRIDLAVWARHVALLPQEVGQYLSGIRETVAEELAFGLENIGVPRAQMRTRVRSVARQFGIEPLLERAPERLSGGQQRLLALAALSIGDPQVLVLDEPLAGLDALAAERVRRVILELRAQGRAVVVLSRLPDALTGQADASFRLQDGTLWPVTVWPTPAPPAITEWPAIEDPATLLAFDHVSAGYPQQSAAVLEDFSLRLVAGECLCLAGANGSGKSTVLKIAAGLLPPRGGTVESCEDIGLLLQNPAEQLFERTVSREVSFGLPRGSLHRQRVERVLDELGLSELAETHPYELPVSARRLLALATVLVREPRVLLLDEPTEALDGHGLERLHRVIEHRLAAGGAVLFSSHDESFMRRTAHRVVRLAAAPGRSVTRQQFGDL